MVTGPRKPPETLDCRRTVLLASLRRLRLPLSRSLRSRDSRGSLRALRSNHERCSAYVAGVRRPLRPLPFPPCYCDRYSMWTVGELLWLVIAPPRFRDVYGVKAFRLATFSGTGQLYPTPLSDASVQLYGSTIPPHNHRFTHLLTNARLPRSTRSLSRTCCQHGQCSSPPYSNLICLEIVEWLLSGTHRSELREAYRIRYRPFQSW